MADRAGGAAAGRAGDEPSADALIADLASAREAYEDRRAAVEDADADVRRVATAHESVLDILERHEEAATDWDDLQGYIEFRDALATAVEDLPEDLPERDAFERADEILKTASPTETLSASDFERAREALAPAAEYADRVEALTDAADRLTDARRAVRRRRDAVADRIDETEAVARFADADLDAPVAELRDPIEAANEAIREAVRAFRREATAREAVEYLDTAAGYPLVDLETVPDELRAYLEDHEVGATPLTTLLEYAEYSPSKLDHYVADPQRFRAVVAANRTALERLDPDPLTVDWPPPPADVLRFRLRALIAVVGRLDDDAVARLREVRALAREDDYERLRHAARAGAALDADQRERLASGAIERDLATLRERHAALDDALDEHPAPT